MHKLAIRFISLLPRNSRLVIYGGSLDLFIDNTKHLFILNNETMPDYEHVWITRNKDVYHFLKKRGFKTYNPDTIKGIWKQIRAGVSIGDIGFHYGHPVLMSGSYQIELWHGIPNKKIMYAKGDIDYSNYYIPKTSFEKMCKSKMYLLNTSHNLNHLMSWAFRLPIDHIILGNYPRNRILMMNENQRETFIRKYELLEFQEEYFKIKKLTGRKIIYMPTFRDGNPDYLNSAIPNYERLNQICKDNNIHFYLKVHRVAKMPDISKFSNIQVLDNKMDIYPMLPLFDLVISDYSGIMFDFPLTGKKVALYIYDLDEYIAKSRAIYDHYYMILDNVTYVKNYEDFLRLLQKNTNEIKEFPISFFWDNINSFDAIPTFVKSITNL